MRRFLFLPIRTHANLADDCVLMAGEEVQYFWPPPDPSKLPNPRRPHSSSASAFVYGRESLNPSLRPSNAISRRRRGDPADKELRQLDGADVEGGEDGWEDSASEFHTDSRGSTPERYLSDDDDEGLGPRSAEEDEEERLRRLEGRMRRGSEGWEVRPALASWNRVPQNSDPSQPLQPPLETYFGPHSGPGPVWLEQGRYNVYEPDLAAEDFSESEDEYQV